MLCELSTITGCIYLTGSESFVPKVYLLLLIRATRRKHDADGPINQQPRVDAGPEIFPTSGIIPSPVLV